MPIAIYKSVILIILAYLQFAIIANCKKNPGDVPNEALYLSEKQGYIMDDELDGTKRTRYWTGKGELRSEKIETKEDTITRHYREGKVYSETRLSELLKEKEKKEIPPKRPENVPNSSFKPEKLSYWASKVKSSNKDKIVWKLWDDDGKKKGYCVFTIMEFNGHCRVYSSDGNAYAKHYYDNGKTNFNVEVYTKKENLDKLSKEQQALVKIIPESEPTLNEKWDQLGNE